MNRRTTRRWWQGLITGLAMVTVTTAAGSDKPTSSNPTELRVATFNVSMEAQNYLPHGERGSEQVLIERLATSEETQIRNIAEIIQRVRPDIIFLTEFDYIEDPAQGVEAFIKNYLHVSQSRQQPIDYPYYFYAPVNTGQPSPYDLDRDGEASGTGADAWGFGWYPGQYGMLLLSKYPIDEDAVRTFQHFKWKDMPDHLETTTEDGEPWYSEDAWAEFRLSSKSHWDVPVNVDGKWLHIIGAHPTPPVFDGPENRNGKRNHDEIRLLTDYIAGADYIYDDDGVRGGYRDFQRPFVIVGDLNASPDEGDAIDEGILGLLGFEPVYDPQPTSRGGFYHSDSPYAETHTASWGLRVDYVLPSFHGIEVEDSGVFWPTEDEDPDDTAYELVSDRGASSDHRLVWVDIRLRD